MSRPLQGEADRSTHNPGHRGPQPQDSANSSKERRPGGCGAGGGPPSLLMVRGMLWTVWSLTHEFVSICSSTDVSEKLLKPEMGAQGRQPVSPPGSLEPPGPPGAFSPAILAAGPQHTPVRRPTGSTGSQGGAAKGQVVRGPGGLGWAEWGEGIFARCSQTQGRLPPGLGLTAVVRGDPGRLPVGSPQTQSSSVPCTPISPPGGGMGRTPEQRTDAVSGLGPWLQQDTRDRNTGGVPGTGRQSHQEHPVPRDGGPGGHTAEACGAPTHPGYGAQPGSPCKRHTRELLSKNGSGFPSHMGGRCSGERRQEAGSCSPRSRAGSALQP